MNTALSTLKPHAKACRSRQHGLRLQVALLLFLLLTAVSTASAAITFDNATASKAKHNTSEISWKHTVGGGANAAVVVAVSFNDLLFNNNQITSVKLGGVWMRPVPTSLPRSSGLNVQTITQLFYLNGAEVPAPGTYDVSVAFTGKVVDAAGGAFALLGVEPGAPAPVATNANLIGLGQISTSINAPAYSWVVDVVGSVSGADFTAGAGQTERFGRVKKEIGLAGSAQAATFGGPTTVLWQHGGKGPLAPPAVALAGGGGGAGPERGGAGGWAGARRAGGWLPRAPPPPGGGAGVGEAGWRARPTP